MMRYGIVEPERSERRKGKDRLNEKLYKNKLSVLAYLAVEKEV